MKKILFIALCCLCLVGCGDKIKIGNDLKIVSEGNGYAIEGSFSNSKKDCGIYLFDFVLKNGDIELVYSHEFPVLIDNDIYEFHLTIDEEELSNVTNLEKYEVSVANVSCSN